MGLSYVFTTFGFLCHSVDDVIVGRSRGLTLARLVGQLDESVKMTSK